MHFDKSRILDESCPRLAYEPSGQDASVDNVIVKGLHFGQRKLLLSEIEFLTAILEKRKREKVSLREQKPVMAVYAGAANGLHLPILFRVFSEVRFVLIDPAPFCKAVMEIAADSDGPVLDLISDYCTDELCLRISRRYSAQYDIYLISDIRSGVPKKMKMNTEHTDMILHDNAIQRSWCWSLSVVAAMLKFHPPYPPVTDTNASNYDPNDNTPESVEYLCGTQLFGVWAPKSSSEVRLVVEGPFCPGFNPPARMYNCKEHEERCYYYNISDRYAKDCTAERLIIDRYLNLFSSKSDDDDIVAFSNRMSSDLGFSLFHPLEPSFTEDNARWMYFLNSVRTLDAMHLYNSYKDLMTLESVKNLVEKYSEAEEVPENVRLDDKLLTREFWSVFCRGDITSAYSLYFFRWKFYSQLCLEGKRTKGVLKRKRTPSDCQS